MSRKDFDKYFAQVGEQYHEMVSELADMSKEYEENIVSPEQYEQMQRMVEPIKRNYETLNYVVFLLDRPARKSKYHRYETQHKNQLKECITDKDVIAENDKALKELQNGSIGRT